MRVKSSGRCVMLALAAAVCTTACAKAPPPEPTQSGRTVNGHTYTDAPVDVKLGPNSFRIPANYLDSQIAPWPGEGVSLVIEWPEMGPSAPGARANPRTNDFRKEIKALVDYIDRAPIETALERRSSNDATTPAESIERNDPRDRLDLRIAQPEVMGLTPYAIDEAKMGMYARAYESRYGKATPRNPRYEADWYIARSPSGSISTFIKCDSRKFRSGDGIALDAGQISDVPGEDVASCVHDIVDVDHSLYISLNYPRAFLGDWKRIEDAFRSVIKRTSVPL
ncbi:hypothetical protein [Stenotrophomonas sp.]|uniref:hypothetical protein n=1 Tax=Stenotrophomonas sp. TaxID=69392 RepID=UPI00289819EC|nr:hypothetical protein [Stenotrophomonas sp.]